MANPVRQFFDSKPEAARVVLVDTSGDIYNASGGGAGSDVNIDSVGGVPIGPTVPVSGTVSVTEPVSVDDNGGSLTVDGPLTDAELRATPVPVSGTVSVNEPVTVDATDLDIRNLVFATDKVDASGSAVTAVVSATDLDIRDLAAAQDSVSVHGDVGVLDQFDLTNSNPAAVAIVDANGDQISSFGGGTQYNQGTPTTDTDTVTMAGAVRRDTAAVASGVADGDRLVLSTDAAGRLRVNASDTVQPVSGTFTADPAADVTASGTIDANGESVEITPAGRTAVSFVLSGTWAGNVAIEGTSDGSSWLPVLAYYDNFGSWSDFTGGGLTLTGDGENGTYTVPTEGWQKIRVAASAWTSGSLTVTARATSGTAPSIASTQIKGANTIASVYVTNSSPASINYGLNVREVARGQGTMATSIPVVIPSNQSAVPVSGTVTVGTITAGDNIIGRVKITDGTDLALVTAAGEQNVIATAQPGVDIGDVTINNAAGASAVNIQDGGNTITVDGTVTTAAPANTIATGTLTAGAQTVSITIPNGASSVGLQVTGVWNGLIDFENTTDGVTWSTCSGYSFLSANGLYAIVSNDVLLFGCGTISGLRVIATSLTSGTANIRFLSNNGVGAIYLGGAIPTGTNRIGTVTIGDGIDDVAVLTDGADNLSNANNELVTAALNYAFDGTTWDRVTNGGGTEATALRVTVANDSTGVLSVDDNGGSLTVDGTVSVNLNAGTNTNEVVGDVAADAPAAGNPVLIAASSETMADSAPANRVSQDADATRLSATDGALFVITTGPQTFQFIATGAQTGAQVHASPGTGLSLYITDITFSINSATASSIKVLNNGGADIWGPHYLEAIAGRGLAVHFTTPLKVTAATRLDVTTTGAATQTTNIQGFIAPG